MATYKQWEEEKGNVFDENKIDEYDKLYKEEYQKTVEDCIEREFKGPYEWMISNEIEQKERIFSIYELYEDYKYN